MKLNWISPLPPARTGIAEYALAVLPSLSERAEIVLWTAQDNWDAAVERYGPVRRLQPDSVPWCELNRADLSIYHLGNNADMHGAIWEVSRLHPGMVILHDLRLHDFVSYYYRCHKRDRDGYLDHMEMLYGSEARRVGELFWDGTIPPGHMQERYPLTELALTNALGVLVHNADGLHSLASKLTLPTAYAPLPYADFSTAESDAPGRRAAGPPFRMIIFGHIGKNRRLEPLLDAWAGLPEKHRLRLDICGEIWNANHIQSRIDALGLQPFATLHGYVPEQILNALLRTAHLAINLRYPSMGEASLSQLMMWKYALPSLVTNIGWYSTLPRETVCFVDMEREVEDIQTHLRAFLSDPGEFAAMGEQGRQCFLDQHAPEKYAECVLEFAQTCQHARTRHAALYLADRAGQEMRHWCGSIQSGDAVEVVARNIDFIWHAHDGEWQT